MRNLLFATILTLTLATSAFADYWASARSNKFHVQQCRSVRMIKKENLISFKTKKEAVRAGYVPCKICRP
jgi:methylphosphotriester-DNA--protein-cysteine methyltransferase